MANRRYIDFPIASTSGDTDIILIWQDGANKQTTKATFLSGLPENLDELNDVAISGLTNGQILRYDSVTGKWENTDQGNLDLNDLNDVSIVSPSNGQVLVYNSSTSKWENSSGGYVPYTGAVTTVNLGAQTIQAGSFVKAGGTAAQFLKANGSVDSNVYGTGTVTSVALTMPTAFSVANSPITTAGTLAVTGAGNVGQYIRGDGSLADFPESSGGGSSVSYYLNGSVAQGTIGGVAYKELNKVPILGAGTDFTINADGYIASFITDAGDPNLLEIPGGNWNFETYFSASSSGGTPTFYVELYKVNSGGTATLIASNSTFPELIAFGTNIISYFSTLAVPTTALALTDRLAIRYYVTHSGRTITLHTEDNHLCQIITTFTTGLTALNGLTAQVQNFAVGTSGTDFNIASATATHTFNLPTASAMNRGALSSADWAIFNNKQNALTNPVTGTGTTNYLPKFTGASTIGNSNLSDDGSNLIIDSRNFNFGNTGFGVYLSRSGLGPRASLTTRSNINWVDIANSSDWSGVTLSASGGNVLIGTTADNGSGARLQNNGALTTNTATVTNGTRSWIISPSGASIQEEFSGVVEGKIDPSSGGNSWLGATSGTTGAGAKHYFSSTGAATHSGLITGQNSIYQSNAAGSIASNRWETFNGGATQMFFSFPASGSVAFNNGTDKFTISNTGAATFASTVSTSNEFYVSGTGQNAFKINSTGTYYGMIQNTAADKWSFAYGINGAGNTALGTSVLTWTGSGNVLIGTTTDNGARLQVIGSAGGQLIRSQTTIAAGRNYLQWANGSGDMGYIGYGGADNKFYVSNQLNEDMIFATNNFERMRITSDGYARLSSTSGGIQFNGDTSSANALDDYEEGAFSPTIFGSSTAGTVTYGARNGLYTKIGRAVSFNLYVDWSAGTGTGSLRLSGLPFTASATGVYPAVAIGEISNIVLTAGTIATARVQISTNEIWFGAAAVGGGANSSVDYDSAGYIVLSGTYYV